MEVYRDAVFCNFHHVCFTVGWRCLRTDWAEQNHIAWGSAGDETEIAWLKIDHLHCLHVSALSSFYCCFLNDIIRRRTGHHGILVGQACCTDKALNKPQRKDCLKELNVWNNFVWLCVTIFLIFDCLIIQERDCAIVTFGYEGAPGLHSTDWRVTAYVQALLFMVKLVFRRHTSWTSIRHKYQQPTSCPILTPIIHDWSL